MRTLARNHLALGLFGSNLSGGLAASRFPERWDASWDNNLALARMADEAGLEFMLPVGRWKGYGGVTNHNGSGMETITWATGLLAATKRLTCFGTVHVTAFNPVVAAKQCVTADHIGHGRFGLNIVCGWYQDEFDMLGVDLGTHDDRYTLGQEWVDIVTRAWTLPGPFDYPGRFFKVKGTVIEPKPYGGTRPLLVSAATSGEGKFFAAKNADMLFTAIRGDLADVPRDVAALKDAARGYGREIEVFTNCYVVCRPTQKEAEEYHHWYAVEMADEAAIDTITVGRGVVRPGISEQARQAFRTRTGGGNGAWGIIGDPDRVAAQIAELHSFGLSALALSFANYLDHLPYFRDEVLPRLERMGLRAPVRAVV